MTLRERALTAWKAAAEEHERQAAEEELVKARDRSEVLKRKLQDALGVDATPSNGNATIDGINFTLFRGHLCAVRPCHHCDGSIYSQPIGDELALGYWLAGNNDDYHEHYFQRESTHPNAPKPQALAEYPPSAEEKLIAALREFIAQEFGGCE